MLRASRNDNMATKSPQEANAAAHASQDARSGGTSLAHLERVLQRLNKHEEKTHTTRVERLSSHAQLKTVQDQLHRVQDELAAAHSSKTTLCTKIGALEQVNTDQKKHNEFLESELLAARESLSAMATRLTETQSNYEQLKVNYIRSTTSRVKTASELLSRLHLMGLVGPDAGDVSAAIQSKCETWIGASGTKRKRVEFNIAQEDNSKTISEDPATEAVTTAQVAIIPTVTVDVATQCTEDTPPDKNDQACSLCITYLQECDELKRVLASHQESFNESCRQLQECTEENDRKHQQYQVEIVSLRKEIEEREATISDLHNEVSSAREQAANIKPAAPKNDEESPSRVKVLEDNLAQLNTYADHLELIIGQCAACSVKLQSESTQDICK